MVERHGLDQVRDRLHRWGRQTTYGPADRRPLLDAVDLLELVQQRLVDFRESSPTYGYRRDCGDTDLLDAVADHGTDEGIGTCAGRGSDPAESIDCSDTDGGIGVAHPPQ